MSDARYAYSADDSLAETARRRGVSPVEAYLDAMVESGGRTVVNWPVMNSDEAAIEELITSPVTIMGLGDAGAHATADHGCLAAHLLPLPLVSGPRRASRWRRRCGR